MLTKADLTAIGELIDRKLDEKLKKELKPIKSELKLIRKNMNLVIRFFDDEITGVRKRVDRIEDFLRL